MKNNIINELKKSRLDDLQKKLSEIDLKKFSFHELGDLVGNIFNELYHQLQPIRDEMNKKYLKVKDKAQNLKKAS